MTNKPETKPAPITREDLKTMTPEAIVTAHETGALAHLTGEGNSRHAEPTH